MTLFYTLITIVWHRELSIWSLIFRLSFRFSFWAAWFSCFVCTLLPRNDYENWRGLLDEYSKILFLLHSVSSSCLQLNLIHLPTLSHIYAPSTLHSTCLTLFNIYWGDHHAHVKFRPLFWLFIPVYPKFVELMISIQLYFTFNTLTFPPHFFFYQIEFFDVRKSDFTFV